MTTIRNFEPEDVDFALRQKIREGWAASREQFRVLLEYQPDGCFVAEERGRPVGMVTTAGFGASGWIGVILNRPGLDWDHVADWLERSWRSVAPKSATRLMDAADQF